MTIVAKPICNEVEVKYDFVLDTQFFSSQEITYKEIVMLKEIMGVLKENKGLAISKLKKWTVQEYKECLELKQLQREQMINSILKNWK